MHQIEEGKGPVFADLSAQTAKSPCVARGGE